jgi:hypothetical protein
MCIDQAYGGELGGYRFMFYESIVMSQRESRLASFRQFVSARQQAGRPVKVSFSPY